MGLWTWAEMSIGVLVCCLPVTPKFFSSVNPKIRSMVTSLRRSGTSDSGDTYVMRYIHGRSRKTNADCIETVEGRPKLGIYERTDSNVNLRDESDQWGH